MKLADYIFHVLAEQGVRDVFMVTGGGAMHLDDAVRKETRIRAVFQHHEQASAMSAEGYARIAGGMGVVCVTTGPGSINALNGVFGAWTDSIPMLIISGQVKKETCLGCHDLPDLRQLGDQEVDIIPMVRGITKYSALVTEPESILYHLEKAVHLACSGRPGPCWLTIPIDVQAAQITPSSLPKFDPGEFPPLYDHGAIPAVSRDVLARLKTAKRPVLLGGTGVRLSGAENLFLEVAETLGIPVTTAWTHDLIPSSHGLFCGRPGTIGTRAGNFTVQNADVLLAIGTRLNIRQTGYSWKDFAPGACLIQVDIDPAELNKPTIRPHLPIVCDARFFLGELHRQLLEAGWQRERFSEWLAWCRSRMERYPPVLASQRTTINGINPYFFLETLFDLLQEDDVIVTGNGAACVMTFQVSALKKGQRLFSNSGSASMGYDLPAAIGAAIAGGHRRVICLAGDGSIQMNLQELQTIVHHHLPIKILVLNNQGYLSIRMTQKNFFGACFGEGPSTGVSFPDIVAVASAYRLAACKIAGASFREQTQEFLDREGPALAEIVLDPDQGFEPKPSSRPLADGRIVSAPLHDMAPFLPREELAENLLGPLHAYLDQE